MLLNAEEVRLDQGRYAFIDGNGLGGIGVVFVNQDGPIRSVQMHSTTVQEVLTAAAASGLVDLSPITIAEVCSHIRNGHAEISALFAALLEVPPHTRLTVVYDFKPIGGFFCGELKAKKTWFAAVVTACQRIAESKQLTLTFRYQPAHASRWAGRHEYAVFNTLADKLATEAVTSADALALRRWRRSRGRRCKEGGWTMRKGTHR
jgi:ribonuclease HI